ncbi:glycosyltransferase [Bacteroides hominis]|uniref:glycosyltransferase n=1 Tax=Bacteroides hominis TaxID=2763023 RepID=UPI003D6BD4D4
MENRHKKKILVYGLSNSWGGVEAIITAIVNRLKENYCFDILLSKGECAYLDTIHLREKCSVLRITSWGRNPFAFSRELKSIYEKNNYDIVWINASIMSNSRIVSITKKYSNAKIITHSHGTSYESHNFIKSIIIHALHYINRSYYLKNIDCAFSCSFESAKWFYGEKYIKKHSVEIIKNGVEVEKFSFNQNIRSVYRQKLGLEKMYVLLHVGRLCKVKNQSFLLEVFAELNQKIQSCRLLIVGDGELNKTLLNQCYALGISDKVLFLGLRNDISSILQAADLFLLPSLHEGLPIVAIEAQAAGLPLILSTGVPKSAKIIESTCFLSVEHGVKEWVDLIISNMNHVRKNVSTEIKGAGYDIKEVCCSIDRCLYIL